MKTYCICFAIVWLLWVSTSGCRSKPLTDKSSDPSTRIPVADSSKTDLESGPIAWSEIASSYERVVDYVCLYDKEEQSISKGAQQKIRFYFRKPFDVRMEWLDARGGVDQTAVYRQGFNDGNVLAHESGLLGTLTGTLQLDPNESLALSDSGHPITDVGIGKIIDRARKDATNPRIASNFSGEESLDGRPAYKFEFTAIGDAGVGGLAAARIALIWIDRDLKLPVKLELYDAARALLERHQFKQMRVNQKLGDKIFAL